MSLSAPSLSFGSPPHPKAVFTAQGWQGDEVSGKGPHCKGCKYTALDHLAHKKPKLTQNTKRAHNATSLKSNPLTQV